MSVGPISSMSSDAMAPKDISHPFVGHGLRSFASLLANARVGGGPRVEMRSEPTPSGFTSDVRLGSSATDPVSILPSSTPTRLGAEAVAKLPSRAQPWLGHIEDAALRHGVDPKLLTALVWTESAFRDDAVSPAGAIGLGQLMPGTAAGMGVDPHDPLENLDGAATYISTQLRNFGSVDLALAAYNAGPGRVQRSGGIPNIAETQAYVRIVTDRYESLSRGGQ